MKVLVEQKCAVSTFLANKAALSGEVGEDGKMEELDGTSELHPKSTS